MIIRPTLTVSTDTATIETMSCGFNYKHYIPKKRQVTKMTSKGSFTQRSNPLFLHGNDYIDFSEVAMLPETAQTLYKYYTAGTILIFNGSFGEEYLVEITEFNVELIGGYWKVTGKFRIICEEDRINLNNKCL